MSSCRLLKTLTAIVISCILGTGSVYSAEEPKKKTTDDHYPSDAVLLYEALIEIQSARKDPDTWELKGEASEQEKDTHDKLVGELLKAIEKKQ